MAFYLISHGMGGGFGGASQDFIQEFPSRDEAEKLANLLAVEDYQSYEGMHGIRDFSEICEEDCEGNEEEAEQAYNEEIDSWIDYSAQEVYLKDGIWYDAEVDEPLDIDSEVAVR